jgi:hypothetical protein
VAVGEKAVMAGAMEAVPQAVQEEVTDELVGRQYHQLELVVEPTIPLTETDVSIFEPEEPTAGDVVGIVAEIG